MEFLTLSQLLASLEEGSSKATKRVNMTQELQSTFSGSVAEKNNLRNQLSLNTVRILNEKNYFAIAVGDLLHSDEQQLDLRSIFGGGVGRTLVSTSSSRILVLGGVVWTREKYTTAETTPPGSIVTVVGHVMMLKDQPRFIQCIFFKRGSS